MPTPPAAHIEHDTNTGISNTKLAMWLFLASECLLFGGLITTYLLYQQPASRVRAGEDLFDIPFTSTSSFVLLMSSLTMVLAVSAIERGDHHRMRVWLGATALLGAIFIAGQVYEFTAFVREGLGFTTSRFSSAFYTLTGFHGVHVTDRHRHVDVAAAVVAPGQPPRAQVRDRRGRRPLLALRRRRVDPDLRRSST